MWQIQSDFVDSSISLMHSFLCRMEGKQTGASQWKGRRDQLGDGASCQTRCSSCPRQAPVHPQQRMPSAFKRAHSKPRTLPDIEFSFSNDSNSGKKNQQSVERLRHVLAAHLYACAAWDV